MAAKRFWPATKLGWANLVLFLAAVVSVAALHGELQWAWTQAQQYRQGWIDNPLERDLYQRASNLLYKSRQPDSAIPLLEKSIEIDPNSEAMFLLAEAYRSKGEFTRAAQLYEKHLDVDYLHIKARLALVEMYRRLKLPDKARETAREGAETFNRMVESYKPVTDKSAAAKFNVKARQVYVRYLKAWKRFKKLQTD